MSVTSTFVTPDNNTDIEPITITDTSENTVLTALDTYRGGMQLREIWLADVDGTANTATIKYTRAGTAMTLTYQMVMAANTPLVLPFNGPVLKKTAANTDTVTVTVGTATVHGYISYNGIREGT